ncbi:hypothetical protein [Streptomyces sp. NPDC127084]|uniref:hypothetical protein n=1 Tax=Streptomyces sp. NPDC127084 TaxID=3347133 RepID=UPI003664C516
MDYVRRGRLHPCPGCALTDRVTAVPAVYQSGRDSMTEVSTDSEGHRSVRSVSTGLTKSLAPAPPPRPNGWGCLSVLGVLVAIGTFAGGALGGEWFEDEAAPDPDPFGSGFGYGSGFVNGSASEAVAPQTEFLFLAWVSAFALVAALLLLFPATRHRAASRKIAAGQPAAEAVWSDAWYCARCGTVHFPDGPGLPRGALSLREFRVLVWEAGGYGHLVGRHPVV